MYLRAESKQDETYDIRVLVGVAQTSYPYSKILSVMNKVLPANGIQNPRCSYEWSYWSRATISAHSGLKPEDGAKTLYGSCKLWR